MPDRNEKLAHHLRGLGTNPLKRRVEPSEKTRSPNTALVQ
jgi:hypothetical protein